MTSKLPPAPVDTFVLRFNYPPPEGTWADWLELVCGEGVFRCAEQLYPNLGPADERSLVYVVCVAGGSPDRCLTTCVDYTNVACGWVRKRQRDIEEAR